MREAFGLTGVDPRRIVLEITESVLMEDPIHAKSLLEDLTQLGGGEDDIDRQLKQLSSAPAVEDDLAKMKAELGQGAPAPQISAPDAAGAEAPGGGEDPGAGAADHSGQAGG